MTRIFVKDVLTISSDHVLDKEDSHYLASVLRMREGEELEVVDGKGRVYTASICEVSKNSCVLTITGVQQGSHEMSTKITLYQSVSKGERMDLTIQKSVELGVNRIVPVISDRCVVKLEGKKNKSDRWQKIALEAARQSGRDIIPVVTEPVSFAEAVKSADERLKVIPWEEAEGLTLKGVISARKADSIAVFIGPEGGFTPAEADMARAHGIEPVTLGKRILRTETAAVTAVSVFSALYGEME